MPWKDKYILIFLQAQLNSTLKCFRAKLWNQTDPRQYMESCCTVVGSESEPLLSQTWALRIGPCACDPDPPVPMQHQEPKLSGIPRPEAASPRGRFFTPFYLVESCSVPSWKDSMRRIQTITKGGRRQTAPALGAGEGDGAHTQDQQGGRGR